MRYKLSKLVPVPMRSTYGIGWDTTSDGPASVQWGTPSEQPVFDCEPDSVPRNVQQQRQVSPPVTRGAAGSGNAGCSWVGNQPRT